MSDKSILRDRVVKIWRTSFGVGLYILTILTQ